MTPTDETVESLEARGWIALWRLSIDALERSGVPVLMVATPPGPGEPNFTTTPMAPAWAIELVTDWPGETDGDQLLRRVIRVAYLTDNEDDVAAAALASYRLSGREGVLGALSGTEQAYRERQIAEAAAAKAQAEALAKARADAQDESVQDPESGKVTT